MTTRGLPVGEVGAALYLSPHPTPDLDPEPALAALIEHARTSILVAVFAFTLADLAAALIERHGAGLTVRVLTDATQEKGATSQIPALRAAGVPVRAWGGNYRLMHDKVCVIDGSTLAIGSYNWTSLAEKNNQEALVVLHGSRIQSAALPALTAQFERAWSAGA